MPNLFQNFLNQVTSGYKEADKRLGGWLPGGGTASPVTRAVFPPQNFPGRSKELQQMTGVIRFLAWLQGIHNFYSCN